MKKKKIMKKCLSLFLTVLAFAASMSVTSSAITVPNSITNEYDTYNVTAGGNFDVTGLMTYAVKDLIFSGMTVAGKIDGSTQKCVSVGVSSGSNYTRYISFTTKNTSGTKISSLSHTSGGVTNSGDSSYETKRAFTVFYILVDSEVKATSSSTVYVAYPNITAKI